MVKLQNEDDVLNPEFRKKVLEEIVLGAENLARKNSELRKHEIYRDMNRKWVIEALINENFKPSTLKQMENRSTNISICKKIINKLAQAYMGGVKREVPENEKATESVDALGEALDFDSAMKKADRYRQLFRNTEVLVVPKKDTYASEGNEGAEPKDRYCLSVRILAPWEYDVIEDPNDLTKKMVLIVSDFPNRGSLQIPLSGVDAIRASQGYRNTGSVNLHGGDGKDQIIADSPSDKGSDESNRQFIWWTDKYHFTTNINGLIVKHPEGNKNPIGRLPSVTVCGDQDGSFWARGGEDVIEGSILINKLLTDINFISFVQGWGQLVIMGKDLPNKIEGGPDNAFIFPMREGDPTPNVFYATSNPPIDKWGETVKMSLALLLSTNNLSPRSISANLDANDMASGIALLIDQSELTVDIQDTQKIFQDKEPYIWEVIRRWHAYYGKLDALVEKLQIIPQFDDSGVKIKFHQIKAVVSEKEKLEALKARKDLGLNTQAELIQMDNPDLTMDEAKAKAKEAQAEKQQAADEAMKSMVKNGVGITNGNKPPDKEGQNGKPNAKPFPPKA